MDNVKVCASFVLPGRTRHAEHSCSENEKVEYIQEKVRLTNGKIQVINLIKPIPAKQSLKVSNIAYDEWITTPVAGVNVKHWNSISKTMRVKAHLMEIAQTLNGELESFEIMKD